MAKSVRSTRCGRCMEFGRFSEARCWEVLLYMLSSYWKQGNLKDLDPTSEINFVPLTRMYMGAKIALQLTTTEYKQRVGDVLYFLKKVQEF